MGIGLGEILIIFIVAFVFVGTENFPKVAKVIGKTINKCKAILNDAKKEMDLDIDSY